MPGYCDQAEQAGHVDDMAAAACRHVRQERLAAMHHAPEIDVHQPVEVFVSHVGDVVRDPNAGIVEDQIDLTEAVYRQGGKGFDGGAVSHVQPGGFDGRARVFQQAGRFPERRFVDVAQHQTATFGGQ